MKPNTLLIIASIIGIGLMLWGVTQWWAMLGINMTMHGWIAYALGVLGSFFVAGGLFYLVFKSAREGYDDIDRPEHYDDPDN
ncbi:MAG: hypothetical protein AAF296_02705 [Pseudomonadota bacterium]